MQMIETAALSSRVPLSTH